MWTSSTIPYVSFNIERKRIGIKHWHQQTYMVFPYCFLVPSIVLPTVYFHIVLSMFRFFVIDRTRNAVSQTIYIEVYIEGGALKM